MHYTKNPPAPQPEAGGFLSNPAKTYAAAGFSLPPPELLK
jgi:hypothetical protein